jgi:hypothetical protein
MASPQQVPVASSLPSSPYCSDPRCAYCKDLREAEEALRLEKSLFESSSRPAESE